MRVDVHMSDAMNYTATLDGKDLDMIVMADDKEGKMHVLEKHWRTGQLIDDPTSPYNGFSYVELTGKVVIYKIDRGEVKDGLWERKLTLVLE